jgi:uncharacterized coiled-coil protein SlyX
MEWVVLKIEALEAKVADQSATITALQSTILKLKLKG